MALRLAQPACRRCYRVIKIGIAVFMEPVRAGEDGVVQDGHLSLGAMREGARQILWSRTTRRCGCTGGKLWIVHYVYGVYSVGRPEERFDDISGTNQLVLSRPYPEGRQ
jgi:hypothetical protein